MPFLGVVVLMVLMVETTVAAVLMQTMSKSAQPKI
jgi:hypothetical protein